MYPRRIVHSLLIISELILFGGLLSFSIIGSINKPNNKEKVWFCSKILTIEKLLMDNMNETFPLLNLDTNIEYNYSYLLSHSNKTKCDIYFKKCGILDTIGNLMCVPELERCPINQIILTLDNNPNAYDYLVGNFESYILYYTNQKIDENIVTKLIINDNRPKYISLENFIFDNETYEATKITYSGYGGGGGFRYLKDIYGDTEITNYILEKLEEEINIDIFYKNIYKDLYIRNYIGFSNNEQMNKFMSIDFKKLYKTLFPNIASIALGYVSIVFHLIAIIFSLTRIFYEDYKNQHTNEFLTNCIRALIIIYYSLFFLGYFIYILVKYIEFKNNEIYSFLKEIKSENFIEDYIRFFISKHDFEEKLAVIEMCILLVSLFFFIFAWIIHIFIVRTIDKIKNSKTGKKELYIKICYFYLEVVYEFNIVTFNLVKNNKTKINI